MKQFLQRRRTSGQQQASPGACRSHGKSPKAGFLLSRRLLPVRFFNAPQRHMLVAVAGVGIHLFHLLKANRFLRTIVDAGKTELTITFRLHAFRGQGIVFRADKLPCKCRNRCSRPLSQRHPGYAAGNPFPDPLLRPAGNRHAADVQAPSPIRASVSALQGRRGCVQGFPECACLSSPAHSCRK